MVPELLSLLVVLTLGVLSPGPDFLLVFKNSVGGSRARAFATVAGIAGGLLAQMVAIAIGFTAMTLPVVRMVQLGGAVFLAWVGVRALRSAHRVNTPADGAGSAGSTTAGAFLEGLGCNLTNPKAFLFYVSMFAHLLRPESNAVWRMVLPLLFVAHAVITWSLVVLALQSAPIARRLTRAQHWLPRVFGVALLSLAVWIAFDAW